MNRTITTFLIAVLHGLNFSAALAGAGRPVGDDTSSVTDAAAENADATTIVTDLNESAKKLKAVFEHDFKTGMPDQLFAIVGNDTACEEKADGLFASNRNGKGIEGIRLCMQLHGDFDIEVKFADLKIEMPPSKGRSGIGLVTCLENETQDSFAVYRRDDNSHKENRLAFVHRILQAKGKLKYDERNVVEKSTSGRLRLARRGDVIYGLYAPEDSNDFQLQRQKKVATGDVGVQGLRLVLQSGKNLSTEVTWQHLKVRAERFSGRPTTDSEPIVAKINAARDDLEKHFVDFGDPDEVDKHCKLDSQATLVREHTNEGLRISLLSDRSQKSCRITTDIPHGENFDIEAELDIHQLETPENEGAKSEVVMQVFLENPEPNDPAVPNEVSFLIRPDYGGGLTMVTRYVGKNRARKKVYRPIRNVRVNSPTRFRVALKDNRIVFLYSDSGSDEQIVAAEYPVHVPVKARSVVFYSCAKGQAFITDVTWKTLTAYSTIAAE